MLLVAALAISLLDEISVSHASTPPEGFSEIPLVGGDGADGALAPTGIAYEPGTGNLFVLEKGEGTSNSQARVRVRGSSPGPVTTALTLSCVDSQEERGLLGIAFDPDYLTGSRFVYLYYTRRFTDTGTCATEATGVKNRVSRFTESGGTLSSETVILEGPYLSSATNHNGGTLRFAPDKTLYISMGDNDTDADANPASRNLNDLKGKILRIERDGSIPADNPFVGQVGTRGEIWAWGLRNPFRFTLDSSDLYIGDVGENTWEEINFGVAGGDYGYPCFEGPAAFQTCNPPPSAPISPIYSYDHNLGSAIIGGPVYRAGVFPGAYDGNLFFGDYGEGWIRRGTIGPNHTLSNVQIFLPDANGVVDMAVSPAGCLTWVGIFGDGVHDVCYGLVADIDGSLRVDGFDLAWLGRAFGALSCDDARYEAAADFDHNCQIDGLDLMTLAGQFGKSLP
jgi:glucose/arabinose dehydrogenase